MVQHPVTTEYFKTEKQISETIKAIKKLKINTIWLWPNIDAGNDIISKKIRKFRENEDPKYIQFYKNFEPEDFLKLLKLSKCIIGNSSVAIRECSFLGVPAVNIGSRQQGRESGGNVINTSHNSTEIVNAIKKQIKKEA